MYIHSTKGMVLYMANHIHYSIQISQLLFKFIRHYPYFLWYSYSICNGYNYYHCT